MEFSIQQGALTAALEGMKGVIVGRPSLSILENVKIEARENVIAFTGSNLETSIEWLAKGTVNAPGATTLPYKALVDLAKRLSPERVDIAQDKANSTNFVIHDEGITISGSSAERGDTSDRFDAKAGRGDLLDIANNWQGEQMVFRTPNAHAPVIVDGEGEWAMVMPMTR